MLCSGTVSLSTAGATLGISGWGCAAGSLEPLTFTRASSAEFCYPRVNSLKTIPFTAAHTYIAPLWHYPAPRALSSHCEGHILTLAN